jgi:hypothetical protein
VTVTITHKRGDTFSKALVLPSTLADGYFVGWNIAAQVRTESGTLVADLVVTWLDEPIRKNIKLFKADTRTWKLGDLFFDIQFTRISDGFVLSTKTVIVSVERDSTVVQEP